MAERQRLNVDLDSLFPGDTLTICEQTISIRPLGIKQLAIIAKKLKGFGKLLSEDGVTWENYNQPENIVKIATVLLDQFPEVLEEASNIDIEDLEVLPIEIIAEILDKVMEVNMDSKGKLEKNFKSLAGRLKMNQKTPKAKSQKQSKD